MLNWGEIEKNASRYNQEFNNSKPFRYVVIENILDPSVARAVESGYEIALSHKDHSAPKRHRDVLGKTGTPQLSVMTDPQVQAIAAFNSEKFVDILRKITGIDVIYADPDLKGGGLHSSKRGGYLNVHTDFNFHPTQNTHRRLNLIIYVNQEWREEWGGALELWNADVSACEATLFPKFNRAVLFETSEISFHGHPKPLTSPDDVTRKSIALYYYSDWPEGIERRAKTRYELTPDQKSELLGEIRAAVTAGATNWEEAAAAITGWQPAHVKKMFRKLEDVRS